MSPQEFKGFVARKRGMSHAFEDGLSLPVTILELLPLTVTQLKTSAKDGYSAVQVGYDEAKEKHLSKGEQGHFKKNDLKLFRHLKEFRLEESALQQVQLGGSISYEFLAMAKSLHLSSKTKGKGFLGGIRRWGQHRGPMSHGSKSHRLQGSIGAGTTPGRVFKGLKMPGRKGASTATFTGIKVLRYEADLNLFVVKGSVPGANDALVYGTVEA
jgi:large subunit ribosomal protein L3